MFDINLLLIIKNNNFKCTRLINLFTPCTKFSNSIKSYTKFVNSLLSSLLHVYAVLFCFIYLFIIIIKSRPQFCFVSCSSHPGFCLKINNTNYDFLSISFMFSTVNIRWLKLKISIF